MANETSSFKARFIGNIATLSQSPLMSNVPRFEIAALVVTRCLILDRGEHISSALKKIHLSLARSRSEMVRRRL